MNPSPHQQSIEGTSFSHYDLRITQGTPVEKAQTNAGSCTCRSATANEVRISLRLLSKQFKDRQPSRQPHKADAPDANNDA
eukprot:754794-Hanusia_phi.AAC.2